MSLLLRLRKRKTAPKFCPGADAIPMWCLFSTAPYIALERSEQCAVEYGSMTNQITDQQDAASVTIITIGYRAGCTAPVCANLARAILRYADAGGRPLVNLERCNRHAREGIEVDTKA